MIYFCGDDGNCFLQISSAIVFSWRHRCRMLFIFSFWCSKGEIIRRRPLAQASRYRGWGLKYFGKPLSNSTISGICDSKAAVDICCSPGLIQGETSTA